MHILSLTSTIKLLYRLNVYLSFVHKEIQIDKVVKLVISIHSSIYEALSAKTA